MDIANFRGLHRCRWIRTRSRPPSVWPLSWPLPEGAFLVRRHDLAVDFGLSLGFGPQKVVD